MTQQLTFRPEEISRKTTARACLVTDLGEARPFDALLTDELDSGVEATTL
jgi:hypothetical protein